MRILGIEGTAWAASSAVVETDSGDHATDDYVWIETDAYQPDSGGINPQEAAQHMGEAIPQVVEQAIDHATERAEQTASPIDAVAFSRGPGLGPCLRIVGTAARAVAQRFDVPLVGVNHMVAHLEVGRLRSGFDSPVCLNASGANAHVLGYRNGRYRVLGETMDTGAGNAIDKFTRHVGWQHPGGPKVERHAREGTYHSLPYVVKGMDFSFSGIMSAAKAAVDDGVPVEDICRGLEETIFGMLTEVSERALSLTDADELVLGGGVGQNDRLTRMLGEMCDQRGAEFFAPEPRFLRDNAGMIALLGARMYAAGDTIEIESSGIDSNFRPDQVDVTWRSDTAVGSETATANSEQRGAEATVTIDSDQVIKHRESKRYRHPDLDERLRTERTRSEARLTNEARRHGVPAPLVLDVDPDRSRIVFQYVGKKDLRTELTPERAAAVGEALARMHQGGFVHGDPTTRNVRIGDEYPVVFIDFGLGYYTDEPEDYAMDLHVFAQSLSGTADDPDLLFDATLDAYTDTHETPDPVLDSLVDIEGRGRYQ
jgi:N6-L-threonylcarbamoyladenine synthase/protein kinase Bud32